MRAGIAFTLLMASLGPVALRAQDPHFGVALNLSVPTGDFYGTTYPPDAITPVPHHRGYDPGIGAQFTVSFPVNPHLAFRLELAGQSESGTDTAAGYEQLHLKHELFGIAGEIQVFPGMGSATRHRGMYLLGGLSADFERFELSQQDSYYDSYGDYHNSVIDTQSKSRLGALVGLGHSFGYGFGGRFTLELAYHKTLTGHDLASGEPAATDFLRLGFGWVF